MTSPTPVPVPPRRNGCLWGCLILVLIVTDQAGQQRPNDIMVGVSLRVRVDGYNRIGEIEG